MRIVEFLDFLLIPLPRAPKYRIDERNPPE